MVLSRTVVKSTRKFISGSKPTSPMIYRERCEQHCFHVLNFIYNNCFYNWDSTSFLQIVYNLKNVTLLQLEHSVAITGF